MTTKIRGQIAIWWQAFEDGPWHAVSAYAQRATWPDDPKLLSVTAACGSTITYHRGRPDAPSAGELVCPGCMEEIDHA